MDKLKNTFIPNTKPLQYQKGRDLSTSGIKNAPISCQRIHHYNIQREEISVDRECVFSIATAKCHSQKNIEKIRCAAIRFACQSLVRAQKNSDAYFENFETQKARRM